MTDSKIAATDKKKDEDGGKELSTAQSSEDGKCSEEVSYQEKQQHKDSKASVNGRPVFTSYILNHLYRVKMALIIS